jgi:fructokinase
MTRFYGGIEAGGTKWICAAGPGPDELFALARIATTTPQETLSEAIAFFQQQAHNSGALSAIGVGSFGPLDPNPRSPTYGRITSTPKPGWAGADIVGPIQQALDIPVAFDTDVNAAAMGEGRWGAAQGLENFVYLTIGTGIGGGAMVNGALLHGTLHPEMGHLLIPHDRSADPFPGACPYHGDCLEGLACGPAIEARWGQRGEDLPAGHPAWDLEAHYLGLGLANLILTLSPQRIILGGGVMDQRDLFPLVRSRVREILHGYVQTNEIVADIDRYIVPPGLGGLSGIAGAIALAQQAGKAGNQ